MDFEKDVMIRKHNLDEEWLNQPVLFQKYATLCAEAELERNKVDEQVKIKRSELTLLANEDPTVMGVKVKPTGGNIEAFYRQHKDYVELKEQLHQANYEFEMLKGCSIALTQRKVALENLVRLHLSAYYADPEVTGSEAQEFNKKVEEVSTKTTQEKVRNRIKRRKKE